MRTTIPAGFADFLLDTQTAEGSFRGNRRTSIWWNRHARGTLGSTDGRLVSCSFEKGEKEQARERKNGSAGRDRASALTLGLDPAAHGVPNLESWEHGCVSLQFGGNRGPGGYNSSTVFAWFSLAGSELLIDGTPVLRAGNFLWNGGPPRCSGPESVAERIQSGRRARLS